MSVVCDKGKERPLGELKATFNTAMKVLQCSKKITIHRVLLALCVCALGRGLPEKVLGLGQRRGGMGSPPPSEVGGGPPPYSPPNCRTPLGVTHWLAAAPVVGREPHQPHGVHQSAACGSTSVCLNDLRGRLLSYALVSSGEEDCIFVDGASWFVTSAVASHRLHCLHDFNQKPGNVRCVEQMVLTAQEGVALISRVPVMTTASLRPMLRLPFQLPCH